MAPISAGQEPQTINLQVSRFDWFDGTQWVNTGAQSEAVSMPDEGLLAAQDSRLWLSVRWLQPSAKTLAVPGGWQWLLAPSDAILVGARAWRCHKCHRRVLAIALAAMGYRWMGTPSPSGTSFCT